MENKYAHNSLNNQLPSRDGKREIPPRHGIILAKTSEISGGKLPLVALQKLYLDHGEKGRSELISNLLIEINEEITIKKEPSKGEI